MDGSQSHEEEKKKKEKGKTDNCWVGYWPLCRSPDAIVNAPFVCVVATICVGEEQSVDPSPLKKFGEFNPVIKPALGCRLVNWILFQCSVQWFKSHSTCITGVYRRTFHCPGDRCPTVLISKALMRMCFLPFPSS